MTGDRDGSVRAIFLAAIMVLSVMVMGVAFAGSAAAEEDSSSTITIAEGDSITISGDTLEDAGAIEDQTAVGDLNTDFHSGSGFVENGLTIDPGVDSVQPGFNDENAEFYPYFTIQFEEPVDSNNGIEDISYAQIIYQGDGDTVSTEDYGENFDPDADWQLYFFDTNGNLAMHPSEPDTFTTKNIGLIFNSGIAKFVENNNNGASVESTDLSLYAVNEQTVNSVIVSDTEIKMDELGQDQTSVQIGSDYYTSIQSAVDNAESGDTVKVDPGTYEESVTIDKALTLQSTEGADQTTIDASGEGTTLKFQTNNVDGGTVKVDGFTITGDSTGTTGLTAREGQSDVGATTFKITNNVFTNLKVGINAWGFGDYNNRVEDIQISNNQFTSLGDSEADGVAAIFLEDLASQDVSGVSSHAATIEQNDFENIAGTDSAGVYLSPKSDSESKIAANAKVSQNDFTSVGNSVVITGDVINTEISKNNFDKADTGVSVDPDGSISEGPIDATKNWWGEADGPSDEGTGSGAAVSKNVEFKPWYATEDLSEENVEVIADGTTKTFGETIQDGVDSASDGDTIKVGPGKFEEDVTINKDDITLTGAGDEETKIIGHGNPTDGLSGALSIDKGVTTAKISELKIKSGATSLAVDIRTAAAAGPGVDFVKNTFVGNAGKTTVFVGGGHDDIDFDKNKFTTDSEDPVSTHLFIGGEASGYDPSATTTDNADNITGNSFENFDAYAIEFEGQHGEISRNKFSNGGESSVAVAIPGAVGENSEINIDGSNLRVAYNDFVITGTGIEFEAQGTLDAHFNWWGSADGPHSTDGAGVKGDILYDPFLNTSIGDVQADDWDTKNYAHDIVIPADGNLHSIAFPAQVKGDVGDVFGTDFSGNIWAYDGSSWVDPAEDTSIDSLDAFMVKVNSEQNDLHVTFEYAEVEGTPLMSSSDLEAGWNFVGAPQASSWSNAFAASTAPIERAYLPADRALGLAPYGMYGTPGPNNPDKVSPFRGYWVFATENGSLATSIELDPSAYEESQGLDQRSD